MYCIAGELSTSAFANDLFFTAVSSVLTMITQLPVDDFPAECNLVIKHMPDFFSRNVKCIPDFVTESGISTSDRCTNCLRIYGLYFICILFIAEKDWDEVSAEAAERGSFARNQ
eukprot:g2318.t1